MKDKQWEELKSWLERFKEDFGKIHIIGSGGNINKIAKIYGNYRDNTISYQQLAHAYGHLKSFTLEERIEKLGLRPDRADVIVPAAKIFLFIIKIIKTKSLFVPKIGFADGLIYQLYAKSNNR